MAPVTDCNSKRLFLRLSRGRTAIAVEERLEPIPVCAPMLPEQDVMDVDGGADLPGVCEGDHASEVATRDFDQASDLDPFAGPEHGNSLDVASDSDTSYHEPGAEEVRATGRVDAFEPQAVKPNYRTRARDGIYKSKEDADNISPDRRAVLPRAPATPRPTSAKRAEGLLPTPAATPRASSSLGPGPGSSPSSLRSPKLTDFFPVKKGSRLGSPFSERGQKRAHTVPSDDDESEQPRQKRILRARRALIDDEAEESTGGASSEGEDDASSPEDGDGDGLDSRDEARNSSPEEHRADLDSYDMNDPFIAHSDEDNEAIAGGSGDHAEHDSQLLGGGREAATRTKIHKKNPSIAAGQGVGPVKRGKDTVVRDRKATISVSTPHVTPSRNPPAKASLARRKTPKPSQPAPPTSQSNTAMSASSNHATAGGKPKRNRNAKQHQVDAVGEPAAVVPARKDDADLQAKSTIKVAMVPKTAPVSQLTPKRKEKKRHFADVVPVTEEEAAAMKREVDGTFRVTSLPDHCEVTRKDVQDPIMYDDYQQLALAVPLTNRTSFKTWSSMNPRPNMMVSNWSMYCGDMDFDDVLNLMRFTRAGDMVNPARASPTAVYIKQMSANKPRYNVYHEDKPCSLVRVVESFVKRPSTAGIARNGLVALPHSQCSDRAFAFFGMIFNREKMKVQTKGGAWEFYTRGKPREDNRGRAVVSNTPVRARSDDYSLDFGDKIPVYNGADYVFDPTCDIDNIASVLPEWDGEVPTNSCAWVAYTAHVYEDNGGEWALSWNILFVVIIGLPSSIATPPSKA
ncbi:hypothetical protein BKA70DRAFT_1447160 [Coprinopsis sp. MPI-PUGE-AT-0042]|nr:hypothetical protein BKA70DRAFT_1447160 [Coprinopsis sp. MPI-PUGE-AT-0042]